MADEAYPEYRRLLLNRRFDEASAFAERAYLDHNRNNPFWLNRQAAALSRAGRFDQAYAVSKEALLLEPSNAYSILAVAEALAGLGRLEEAILYFKEILTDSKLTFHAKKGILGCLTQQRSWEKILHLLSEWNLSGEVSFRWKVKALSGLNRLNDAMDICRQWLEKKPDNPSALWELTELEIKRDGLETVLPRMGRLAKIQSRPPVYKEIYASLCRRAGKPEMAIKQYEKLTKNGADPRIQRKQAFALAKSGKEMEAIPMMEELLKLDPKDFYVHKSYIAACNRAGQLDRGEVFYGELLEKHPEERSLYGRIKKMVSMRGEQP